MKKYKLLKDLPFAEAGTTCVVTKEIASTDLTRDNVVRELNGSMIGQTVVRGDELEKIQRAGKFDEWFEEVDESKESKAWKPQLGEHYWCVCDGIVVCYLYRDDSIDEGMLKVGSYFKSKKDAEKAAEKLKALRRLREKGLTLKSAKWLKDGEIDVRIHLDNSLRGDWETVGDFALLFTEVTEED